MVQTGTAERGGTPYMAGSAGCQLRPWDVAEMTNSIKVRRDTPPPGHSLPSPLKSGRCKGSNGAGLSC